MSFFEALKKVGGAAKKVADRAAKEVKWRKKVGEAKREILSRFTVKQLERIASSKRISLYEEDFVTGERWRLRTKVEIVDKIASELDFQEIVNLAKRHKIMYSDVVQELEKFRQKLFEEKPHKRSDKEILEDIYEMEEREEKAKPQKRSKSSRKSSKKGESIGKTSDNFVNLLKWIERNFRPPAIKDEPGLKEKLLTLLNTPEIQRKLGIKTIQEEVVLSGRRIDIVINNKWGIELKVVKRRNSIDRLPTQINAYKKNLEKVAVIIVKPPEKEFNLEDALELIPEDVYIVFMEVPLKKRTREIVYTAKLIRRR